MEEVLETKNESGVTGNTGIITVTERYPITLLDRHRPIIGDGLASGLVFLNIYFCCYFFLCTGKHASAQQLEAKPNTTINLALNNRKDYSSRSEGISRWA